MFCKLPSRTPLKETTKRKKNVYIVKVFRVRLETLILVRKTYIPRPRAGRSGVLFPVQATDFSSSTKRRDRLCGQPSFLLNRYRGYFLWVKRPGLAVNQSSSSV